MDIKEFRIREDALNGFYIEREFTEVKIRCFLFFELSRIESKKWKPVNALGDELTSVYCFGQIIRNGSALSSFKTKEDAIEYLEKLCTPDKFYYPTDFKESHE